ncbi:MAG: rhodanese-like domain-containing protein [Vicinamibacterales bacterium]
MTPPRIHVSDQAKTAIRQAAAEAGDGSLRIGISDTFEYALSFGPFGDGDVAIDCGGLTILLDGASARRADGLSLDFVAGPETSGFTIENPNAAATVQQISVLDLKALLDSGAMLELIDVRTEEERTVARIDGSRLLDQEGHAHLMSLDRNATVVFQCHHGSRSQAAAEYFLSEGFRRVYNLQGGIDAWSQVVDPTIPRY